MAFKVIIGDIHGNLPALRAVANSAGGRVEGWICVGDTVGYGPFPNECLEWVSGLESVSVCGNHDLGCLGSLDLGRFNAYAREACEWTRRVLGEDEIRYLGSLPEKATLDDALLVHGSPRDPVWEYVVSKDSAGDNFSEFAEGICFHGHSHVPAVFRVGLTGVEGEFRPAAELITPPDGELMELEEGFRYMVNVGSVGQPRDGDPRACYVEYDPWAGTLRYCRVEYPLNEVQERMGEVGLPAFLIERLAVGR